MINGQLDDKLEQFTGEELDTVLKNIKTAGLDELTPVVEKTIKNLMN